MSQYSALVAQAAERFRLPAYRHQLFGTEKIVEWDNIPEGRIYGGCFFLADEMGSGKTKQTIDAAEILADSGLIDHVVIVAPNSVRGVWFDPELGELTKHMWSYFPSIITEYHAKSRDWPWFLRDGNRSIAPKIRWTITNYDFIRRKERLKPLLNQCNDNTMLVLDESSAVKNYRAEQTKACEELRSRCSRVLLLNGTPIANNPGDLYSQAYIMDPRILACKTWFHFRARYAIMGGWQNKQVIKWQNIDDLQRRLAPYMLRRLKEQCIDLPEKIPSVSLPKALTPKTWVFYKQMKDDMVAWLNDSTLTSASQAIVKVIRLAQVTSGFVGGVEEQEEQLDILEDDAPLRTKDPVVAKDDLKGDGLKPVYEVQEVGREKLDCFLDWFEDQLGVDSNLKLLCWCRFRPEVQRLYDELVVKYPKLSIGRIWGGQTRQDREASIRLLDPRTMPEGPVVVIGTPASGAMGLNLTGAHTVIYVSNDFSLKTRLQSEDRVHRPGQIHKVSYFDIIATGPTGQKTIDYTVIKALTDKKTLADFTTSAWIQELND